MIKSNWIKRGAAAVVMAGLLGTAVPSVVLAAEDEGEKPAVTIPSADQTDSSTNKVVSDSLVLQKTWETPDGSALGKEIFTFKVQYKGEATKLFEDAAPKKSDGSALLSDAYLDDVNIEMNDTDADGDPASQSKTWAEVLDGLTFDKPGQYKFLVTEQDGNNGAIDYNKGGKKYELVVNVQWKTDSDFTPIVTKLAVRDLGTTDKADDDVKTDIAKFDNGAASGLGSFEFGKEVSGAAADVTQTFKFTFTISGLTGSTKADLPGGVTLKKVGDDNKETAVTDGMVSNGTYTVELHDNQYVKLSNLLPGVNWTVKEEIAYDSTDVTGEGLESEDGTPVSREEDDKSTEPSAQGTIQENDTSDKVVFTNKRGFLPDTGITMNTLPFVAVGAVAAAGAVTLVVSRVRRSHEDF